MKYNIIKYMKFRIIISLIHIFITGIFLLYLGWEENNSPKWAYILSLILGILIFLVWVIRIKSKNIFMIIIHLCIVVPLLLAIGLLKNKTPIYLYKISIIIGSASIGYHILSLLKYKFKK